MGMANSRGNAISAYVPAFAKGALIYGANVQSGVITSAHIADGTVVAADVAAGSITSAKLGASSVTNAKMKAAFLSGTLVSGVLVTAVAHGLGATPKSVVVCALLTKTQLEASSARSRTVQVAAASAANGTNIFLCGTQPANEAIKYAAYVQI